MAQDDERARREEQRERERQFQETRDADNGIDVGDPKDASPDGPEAVRSDQAPSARQGDV